MNEIRELDISYDPTITMKGYTRGRTVGDFIDDNVNSSVSCHTDFGGKVTEIDTDDALSLVRLQDRVDPHVQPLFWMI